MRKMIRPAGFGIVILAATLNSTAEQGPPSPVTQAGARGLIARVGGNTPYATVRPDAFGLIQGNALDSTNGQLANATVRLRDARFGRILGAQLTDHSGLFTFKGLDPGSYIVEMMGNEDTVL